MNSQWRCSFERCFIRHRIPFPFYQPRAKSFFTNRCVPIGRTRTADDTSHFHSITKRLTIVCQVQWSDQSILWIHISNTILKAHWDRISMHFSAPICSCCCSITFDGYNEISLWNSEPAKNKFNNDVCASFVYWGYSRFPDLKIRSALDARVFTARGRW